MVDGHFTQEKDLLFATVDSARKYVEILYAAVSLFYPYLQFLL